MIFSNSCYKSFSVLKEHPWSPAWDQLVEKPIYATVKNDEILMQEDQHRLKRKLNHFFSLKHDPNLWVVNQRLKSIYDQTIQGQGQDFEKLKNEIHRLGPIKFRILSTNLMKLATAFRKASHENILVRSLRKINHAFCRLFHQKFSEQKSYADMDMKMFIERLRTQALELTDEEKKMPMNLETNGNVIPKELNRENFQKLFLNLVEEIRFNYGDSKIVIRNPTEMGYLVEAFPGTGGMDGALLLYDEKIEIKDQKLGILSFGIYKNSNHFINTKRVDLQNPDE